MPSKRKLPRKRSASAAALAKPVHRHRVIPDKRRVVLERDLKKIARRFGPALRSLASK